MEAKTTPNDRFLYADSIIFYLAVTPCLKLTYRLINV